MLDSHSKIWGMGEDSIFNANLTEFRNKLVSAPPGKGKRLDAWYLLYLCGCLFVISGVLGEDCNIGDCKEV
jgi:hypothetical protein